MMRPFMVMSMFFTMAVLLVFYSSMAAGAVAEPPRVEVDPDAASVTGRSHAVRRGQDLQRAIDRARPGDEIVLEAGAVYRGPFILPHKEGEGWITIRSDQLESLPAGIRVEPAAAKHMPVLTAASGPAIATHSRAHHYRFVGIEVRPAGTGANGGGSLLEAGWDKVMSRLGRNSGDFINELIALGDRERSAEDLPHHFIFDRCYIHGDPAIGARRGIRLNAAHVAVVNSYFADFKEVGADSQAMVGWNGTGPFLVENNYLEGAGENLMFGGATPSITGLVPADIVIRGNHFAKPLSWREKSPEFAGTAWSVKNLFELKNARRVLVDGNLFEYNWPQAQNGFAILFTVRNEDGAAPWAVIEDVSFTNNVLRHIGNGINILGYDHNSHPSGQTKRIHIANNLFYDVGGQWGGGRLFQLLDGTADVHILNNTALQDGDILMSGEGRPHTGFRFIGNIVRHNEYGVLGTGTGTGMHTLESYFPGAAFRDNVLIGGPSGDYPRDNDFPRSPAQVGFIDPADANYRLEPGSRYRGKAGVDAGRLCPALAARELYEAANGLCLDGRTENTRGTGTR